MAYDPATGLPLTLTSTPTGQSARTFTYSFAPNTQLITGWSTGALSTAYSVIYGYETTTNRRNQVKNTMGGATIAEFDPTYDSRGQMQNIMQSGSAFADYFNTSYSSVLNAYSYDAMGELQASALYRGSTTLTNGVPASADELTGHKFLYSYDSMGNRLSAGESGTTNEKGGTDDSYTPNNLNQYTQRDNYTVRVVGTTATPPTGKSIYTAVAEAPSSKTNQVDRSWNADIVPGQGTNVATGTATVYAAIPGGGTGGQDIVRTNGSKSYTVPPTPQMYHYDFDGNLSDDGVWNYTYDAESRLIGMQNLATAIGSGKIAVANARKLVFTYDYLGRRIEKQVYGGWDVPSSTYSSTAILDHKFIYSGWNLVAEYNAIPTTLTLARSFTWGLDLGGSIANSGGVGALLQVTDHIAGQNYFPAYDQNGNVVALESDTGILAAGYEYSSFGDPMRADVFDSTVVDNPFRFSTKYTDLETGLVYYGMRYYGTKEGRFINRDPAQESGGANLYGIVGNNSVSNWDFLGLVEASNEVPVVMAPYVITCPIPHYSPPVGPTAQQLTDEHNKQTAIDDVNNSKKTDGGVGGQDGGSGNSGGGDATTTTTPDTPEKTPCEQAKENIRATREKMASLDQAEVAARNSLDIVQTKLDELSGKYAETVVSDCASLIEIPGGAEEYNEAINMAKTLTVNMPLDGKALYDAHKEHSTGDTMQAIASTIADVAVVTNVTLKTNANIHLPGASKIGPIATAVGIIGAIRNWAVYASNDSNYSFQVGDAKTKLNSVLNQEADLNDQYGQQLGAMSRICGDSK
jgi:RHS repeat-associated protein